MSALLEVLFGNQPIAWVQGFFGLGHPLPFRVLSLLGDTWGMMLVIGLALWFFGREAMHAVVGMVAAGAVTKALLSLAFSQSRPAGPGIVVYDQLEWSSFPSGHVYETVGPWGLLWALGYLPIWIPVAMTVLVSLGRLYLGVHYLGDVAGGVIFALPLVWAYARVWPRARAWLACRPRRLFHLAAAALIGAALAYSFLAPPVPRRFEVIGIVIGGTLGLLLQARGHASSAPPASRRRAVFALLLAVAGLGALVLFLRTSPHLPLWFSTVAAAAGMLWVLELVPRITPLLIRRR